MGFDPVPDALAFAKGDRSAGAHPARPAATGRDARRVVLVPEIHPLRAATEACIRDVYARVFGALPAEVAHRSTRATPPQRVIG